MKGKRRFQKAKARSPKRQAQHYLKSEARTQGRGGSAGAHRARNKPQGSELLPREETSAGGTPASGPLSPGWELFTGMVPPGPETPRLAPRPAPLARRRRSLSAQPLGPCRPGRPRSAPGTPDTHTPSGHLRRASWAGQTGTAPGRRGQRWPGARGASSRRHWAPRDPGALCPPSGTGQPGKGLVRRRARPTRLPPASPPGGGL